MERKRDYALIGRLKDTIIPVIEKEFDENGRGVFAIDLTIDPDKDESFCGYTPETDVEDSLGADVLQLVQEYTPETEIVVAISGQNSINGYRLLKM